MTKQKNQKEKVEEKNKGDSVKYRRGKKGENRNGEGNVWKWEVSKKAHCFQIIIF